MTANPKAPKTDERDEEVLQGMGDGDRPDTPTIDPPPED